MGKDMFKLGLNLLIISAVAALLLALTNSVTASTIAQRNEQANAELCLHRRFRLYAGQIRKTLWMGCRGVCNPGRTFRVRPYHICLSARPAGIQRAHDAASFLYPAGCDRTADYEDIERIKHHEQETCSVFFCVRRDREGS